MDLNDRTNHRPEPKSQLFFKPSSSSAFSKKILQSKVSHSRPLHLSKAQFAETESESAKPRTVIVRMIPQEQLNHDGADLEDYDAELAGIEENKDPDSTPDSQKIFEPSSFKDAPQNKRAIKNIMSREEYAALLKSGKIVIVKYDDSGFLDQLGYAIRFVYNYLVKSIATLQSFRIPGSFSKNPVDLGMQDLSQKINKDDSKGGRERVLDPKQKSRTKLKK